MTDSPTPASPLAAAVEPDKIAESMVTFDSLGIHIADPPRPLPGGGSVTNRAVQMFPPVGYTSMSDIGHLLRSLRGIIADAMRSAASAASAAVAERDELYPLDDWSDDDSFVLWFKFPIDEPPYVGSPLCCDWPGYHTHWRRIAVPLAPPVATRATLQESGIVAAPSPAAGDATVYNAYGDPTEGTRADAGAARPQGDTPDTLGSLRDDVLNGRHELESVLDNDQTNAVLAVIDRHASALAPVDRAGMAAQLRALKPSSSMEHMTEWSDGYRAGVSEAARASVKAEEIQQLRRDDPAKFVVLVAHHVMGWRKGNPRADRWADARGDLQAFRATWNPAANAQDDYATLVKVRETWDKPSKREFIVQYIAVIRRRDPSITFDDFMAWCPGDYSAAALAVVLAAPHGEGEARPAKAGGAT